MEKIACYVTAMSVSGLIYSLISAIPLAAITRSFNPSISRWQVFVDGFWDMFSSTLPYTMAVGGIIGLVGVGYEFYRYGLLGPYPDGETLRLIQNLFWCLLYAQLIHLAGAVVCFPLTDNFDRIPLDTIGLICGVMWVLGIVLFNFVAIVWALAQTINTSDVLVPNVLSEKLKARMRL